VSPQNTGHDTIVACIMDKFLPDRGTLSPLAGFERSYDNKSSQICFRRKATQGLLRQMAGDCRELLEREFLQPEH
jgi:hypothetical protein